MNLAVPIEGPEPINFQILRALSANGSISHSQCRFRGLDQRPVLTCQQQLAARRGRRNGCRANGADGHPLGSRHDSRGVLPHGRS